MNDFFTKNFIFTFYDQITLIVVIEGRRPENEIRKVLLCILYKHEIENQRSGLKDGLGLFIRIRGRVIKAVCFIENTLCQFKARRAVSYF